MTAAGLSQTQSEIIIEQIQSIQKDESTHASVLTAAIQANGGTPVTKCSFNFAGTLNDVILLNRGPGIAVSVLIGLLRSPSRSSPSRDRSSKLGCLPTSVRLGLLYVH